MIGFLFLWLVVSKTALSSAQSCDDAKSEEVWRLTSNYDDPTLEELAEGYSITAHSDWGRQAREQKSLRIACFGGSNTQGDDGYAGYVHLLDHFVKLDLGVELYSNFSNPESIQLRDRSFAHNRGVSGRSIDHFIGKVLDFESSESLNEWPNVILIENGDGADHEADEIDVTEHLERFVRSVNYKYARVGLPAPDYMFYNMPYYSDMIQSADGKTALERSNESVSDNWAFQIKKQVGLFAAHYGMPVLDWGDALFPAFQRRYLNTTLRFDEYPWKYTSDGVHMSTPIGTSVGQRYLLGPFFVDVMRPRGKQQSQPRVEPPRLYPPSTVLLEVVSYTANPLEVTAMSLGDVIDDQNSDWKVLPLAEIGRCFGSSTKGNRGVVNIAPPAQCSSAEPCNVQIHMYHSWNSSLLGSSVCTLHSKGLFDTEPLPDATIVVNGAAFRGVHTVKFNVTSTGEYSLKCVNQDDLLSCVVSVDIVKPLVM